MKSKIEQKIEKAREATNEMLAAFEELNEMLSERVINVSTHEEAAWLVGNTRYKPKFKFGDWVRTDNGFSFEVERIEFISTEMQFGYHAKDNNVVYEKFIEKWVPRRGEGYFVEVDDYNWICIAKAIGPNYIYDAICFCKETNQLYYSSKTDVAENFRPATPEEIALLDSKLAEQGKRFDKEKLELVDIPKHKEPIIGETGDILG